MKTCLLVLATFGLVAQETPQPAKPKIGSVIGEVKTKDGGKLTVRSDAGELYTIDLQERTVFLRVQPGEKDLEKASKIAAGDVNVGDRVIARGVVNEEQKLLPAIRVIVMTKTDLEQKQAKERAEWQRRGASGVVSMVSAGTVTINSRVRGETKAIALAVGPDTRVRRYAPDSVRFNDAKPSTAGEIKAGDQVRVLGDKNEDGSKITAEEMVFGTFRTIPATVISADAKTGELKVTDLDTKKPLIVLVTAESQVKKLPEMMAQMIARQVNPSAAATTAFAGTGMRAGAAAGASGQVQQQAQGQRPQGAAPGPGAAGGQAAARGPGAPGGGFPGGGFPGGGGYPGAPGGSGGFGGARGDLSAMLERLPAFSIADLAPGDPLIISSTAGTNAGRVSAITVLAGVEPILRSAPRSAGQINLGSWSLEMNMPQ